MDFQRTKPTFDLGGRQFPRLTWWREPGMRGLYIRLFFVILVRQSERILHLQVRVEAIADVNSRMLDFGYERL